VTGEAGETVVEIPDVIVHGLTKVIEPEHLQ
jgi:hypothetical protein